MARVLITLLLVCVALLVVNAAPQDSKTKKPFLEGCIDKHNRHVYEMGDIEIGIYRCGTITTRRILSRCEDDVLLKCPKKGENYILIIFK